MILVFVVVAVVVVFAVAATAVGRGGGLEAAEPDLVWPWLPAQRVFAEDIDSLRFAVGFRGYRMDQVDEVLTRLGNEIAVRDERIAELEQLVAEQPPSQSSPPR